MLGANAERRQAEARSRDAPDIAIVGSLDYAIRPSAIADQAGVRVRLLHEKSKGTRSEIVKKCAVAGVERTARGGLRPGGRNSEENRDEER